MRRSQPDGFWEAQHAKLRLSLGTRPPPARNQVLKRIVDTGALIEQLCMLLTTSCGVEGVGADAPLMTSGLESTDVPRFVDALNEHFDTWLPPTLVLDCGTIRSIATRLSKGTDLVRQHGRVWGWAPVHAACAVLKAFYRKSLECSHVRRTDRSPVRSPMSWLCAC